MNKYNKYRAGIVCFKSCSALISTTCHSVKAAISSFKYRKLNLTERGSTLDVKIYICRRLILTSQVDLRTVRVKIFIIAVDKFNICIQMRRKELTKTFMMISNCKKNFGLHGLYENISTLYGLTL